MSVVGDLATDASTFLPKGLYRRFLNRAEAGYLAEMTRPADQIAPAIMSIRLSRQGMELLRAGTPEADLPKDRSLIAAMLKDLPKGPIDLVLADGACLDITSTLPAAALSELPALIENEISFQSPFDLSKARWVWAAEEADTAWSLKAALVLKDSIDPLLGALKDSDRTIGRIIREGQSEQWIARDSWMQETKPTRPLWMNLCLLAAVAFLLAFTGQYVFANRKSAALDTEMNAARAVLASATQEQTASRIVTDARDLSLRKITLINDLARVLPDDTWLEQVSITEDGLEIVGYASSAAETTQQLAGIPGLSDVRFSSPVTRDNSQNTERFRIAATLDGAGP